jgi:uncharacterized protein YegL
MTKMPGGELATRPLHFIWICDCSGSMMAGGKIQSLNTAIKEALPAMRKVADENPNATVLVRALKFSSGAEWVNKDPVSVEDFKWFDLEAEGVTDMGKALSMVADELKIPPMTSRALPPVLVLISDGQPTDDFDSGLKKLMDQNWGKKAVRISIAIGGDADNDVLQKFIGISELKPLIAKNAEALVKQIKWVSTAVLQSASSPASQTTDSPLGTNVPIPVVPADIDNPLDGADDVW